MRDLTVSELFGPTFQGEGPNTGRQAMFVRLGRCNLDCAWCDTPYTWDWHGKNGPAQDPTALRPMSVTAIYDDLAVLADDRIPELVVVTGGEPMLQRTGVIALVEHLDDHGHDTEIETNGTISPLPGLYGLVRYNVSPKLAHSGVTRDAAINPAALEYFVELARCDEAAFKFVARDRRDLDEIAELVDRFAIPTRTVWVMPEGRDSTTITTGLQALATDVLARRWNLSGRLHVTIWEDRRGV